jgi:hypothetical protein
MDYLSTSKNGFKVNYEKYSSHAATHIEETPKLLNLLREIIPALDLDEDYIELEYDFGKPVGLTDLVVNSSDDEIVYYKRKNREYYNPFNKSKNPKPCNHVSLALKKLDDKHYELLSAYIGREGTPPFPGEAGSTDESIRFWNTHSFVFGVQQIQEDSFTEKCPW